MLTCVLVAVGVAGGYLARAAWPTTPDLPGLASRLGRVARSR